jgi:hypothetical protein
MERDSQVDHLPLAHEIPRDAYTDGKNARFLVLNFE